MQNILFSWPYFRNSRRGRPGSARNAWVSSLPDDFFVNLMNRLEYNGLFSKSTAEIIAHSIAEIIALTSAEIIGVTTAVQRCLEGLRKSTHPPRWTRPWNFRSPSKPAQWNFEITLFMDPGWCSTWNQNPLLKKSSNRRCDEFSKSSSHKRQY